MNKQTKPGMLLAALAAIAFTSGAAFAQGKEAPRCVGADGKEKMSMDGKPITTQSACEKAGGKMQTAKK